MTIEHMFAVIGAFAAGRVAAALVVAAWLGWRHRRERRP